MLIDDASASVNVVAPVGMVMRQFCPIFDANTPAKSFVVGSDHLSPSRGVWMTNWTFDLEVPAAHTPAAAARSKVNATTLPSVHVIESATVPTMVSVVVRPRLTVRDPSLNSSSVQVVPVRF